MIVLPALLSVLSEIGIVQVTLIGALCVLKISKNGMWSMKTNEKEDQPAKVITVDLREDK